MVKTSIRARSTKCFTSIRHIAAAAAVGVPDELYGEEVAAVVVLKPDANTTEQEVIDFCKARLADYKCPKTVHFVEDIPKGPTGKLLKRELAKMLSSKRNLSYSVFGSIDQPRAEQPQAHRSRS